MKVKCIKLFDVRGREVDHSAWLTLGKIYHVLSMSISPDGKRKYAIVTRESKGEWPHMGSYRAECFEVITTIVPSNWRLHIYQSCTIEASPFAWQANNFKERFYDHDHTTYPIFASEREIILREDP